MHSHMYICIHTYICINIYVNKKLCSFHYCHAKLYALIIKIPKYKSYVY